MDLGLKDKLVVVGGGEGGVGTALCKALKEEGAIVVSADIKSGIDLSSHEKTREFFSNLRQQYHQGLYGFVSSVYDGQTAKIPFIDATQEQMDIAYKGTYSAAYWPAIEAARWMKETGGGHILVLSTVNTKLGLAEGPYETMKGAVNRIAPSIATQYGSKGVYAITLLAGTIAPTPPWEGHDDLLEQVRKTIPDKRVTTPEEVSNVIAFLLSSYANAFNGNELLMDRGWTLVGPVLGFDKSTKK